MDKTYQLGSDSKSYLISPWTTEEVFSEETCFEIDGPVQPQSVLPANISAFEVLHFFKLIAEYINDHI